MEEQSSWKGHTFTLLIFGGIVVLCSIFFVLGMLVGRTQGTKMAAVTTAEAASRPASKDEPRDEAPRLTMERSAVKSEPSPLPAEAKPQPKTEPSPPPPGPASAAITLQIAALKKQADAEKQVDDLKKKGFSRAFILAPAPGDGNPFYRVQVAVSDVIEAESVKQKLEAAGFKPILKK